MKPRVQHIQNLKSMTKLYVGDKDILIGIHIAQEVYIIWADYTIS